jgi:F-type H+-transporting ATPase subunit O
VLQVDASIIGGLVIDVGDKHIDLSINTKIRKMEALLQETA